jgi:uncharacterized protein
MYVFLLASLFSFLFGPLFQIVARNSRRGTSLLDGYIFVTVPGILSLFLLPELYIKNGWAVFLFALAGLLLPKFQKKHGKTDSNSEFSNLTLFFIVFGLSFHALLEGISLSASNSNGQQYRISFGLALVLHHLPVSIFLWWLIRSSLGFVWGSLAILSLVVTTSLGFFLADTLSTWTSGDGWGFFQAFVVGSLAHIIIDHPLKDAHIHKEHEHHVHEHHSNHWFSGVGGGLGLLTIFLLLTVESLPEIRIAAPYQAIVHSFYNLALISAPALLLGYTLAGFLEVFLPNSSIRWLKKGSQSLQALKGMVIGLPTPVCSCGVIPIYRSLVSRGAPPAAALSFLIATPELGIDAVLLSIPLLGIQFTLFRLFGAALIAFSVAWFVSYWTKTEEPLPVQEKEKKMVPLKKKLLLALQTGFGETLQHTAPWILFGLVIAAVIEPMVDKQMLSQINPSWDVIFFAIVGIPIYVCATGATPFVAVLLAKGISPGAALAFLLTGPATNLTTFGIISQMHGRQTAVLFSISMIVTAIALGYAINPFFSQASIPTMSHIHDSIGFLQHISFYLLAFFFLQFFLSKGPRNFLKEMFPS